MHLMRGPEDRCEPRAMTLAIGLASPASAQDYAFTKVADSFDEESHISSKRS
jgi:hypothetical protein